jgi:hypothetical protein
MIARITLAAITATLAVGSWARAASHAEIDFLAVRLQAQARELYGEFRMHYSHAAHARQLMSNAANVYYAARHIHELAHVEGSLDTMAYDVARLDGLFHQLEHLVEHIEHDAFDGVGHVHGHTGHVHGKMARMEVTLQHLRAEVDELRFDWRPLPAHDDHDHDHHVQRIQRVQRVGGVGLIVRPGGLGIQFGR